MAKESIKIFIADPVIETRVELKKILFEDPSFEIVDEGASYTECINKLGIIEPDILLINLTLEDASGLKLAYDAMMQFPEVGVILLADSSEIEDTTVREAMHIGVKDIVTKPFDSALLIKTIRNIFTFIEQRRERLASLSGGGEKQPNFTMSIFSTKGGVGRTLFAVNTAIMLKKLTNKKVVLIDLDLQFGDCAVMMGIKPLKTIVDATYQIPTTEEIIEKAAIDSVLMDHISGIKLLAAPVHPEEAEHIKAEHITAVLKALAQYYDYIIIDTPTHLDERILVALDFSDIVFLLLTLELPTIKDGKLMTELLETLQYPKEKVKLVINRNDPRVGIQLKEVEEALGCELIGQLPSEGRIIMPSVNEGDPVAVRNPASEFIKGIVELIAKALEIDVGGYLGVGAGGSGAGVKQGSLSGAGAGAGAKASSKDNIAPVGKRIAAGIIDIIIAMVIYYVFFGIAGFLGTKYEGGGGINLIILILKLLGGLLPLVFYILTDSQGAGPGKKLMKIKIVTEENKPPNLITSIFRVIVFAISSGLIIGLLLILVDKKKRGLHDIVAKTTVVV